MVVEGEMASRYQAVLLSSLEAVPGTLVRADDQTGDVIVKDKTGETKSYTYGQRQIRIIPKHR